MKEVVVPFKSWHLLFLLPRLFLNLRVIAFLGCDLLVCKARYPFGYELVKVLLLKRDRVAHLDVVRAVLVELIDPDAPVRVGRAVIGEPLQALVPYHREELQDKYEDHEDPAYLETHRLHHF
jgi:hypothetical protein